MADKKQDMLINQPLITNNTPDTVVIQYLDKILQTAITRQASDIHFEPHSKNYRLRLRIDGLLYILANIDFILGQRLISRLKILANLNIAERRLPQDGRFTFYINNHEHYDCRLSSCPMLDGEKLVVRILSPLTCVIHRHGFN